jgi:hypothetical protein
VLLKVVFDKTAFVKLMKNTQNNQKSIEKSIPAYEF